MAGAEEPGRPPGGFIDEVGGQRFGSYLVFAFVRNPFDRAVSQCAWQPKVPCLTDPTTGELLVDTIGRFETFEHDVRRILSELGVQPDAIPHVNASERGPYRDYYTASDRRLMESVYGEDLDRLGYAF